MKDQLKRIFRSPLSLRRGSGLPNDSAHHLQKRGCITALPLDTPADLSSPPVADFWQKALHRLSMKDQLLIQKHTTTRSTSCIVSDMPVLLLEEVKQKRELFESRRWNVSLNGFTFRLSDIADKVTTWLEKLKAIGDIAVNADLIHARLPWAGIRTLLLVATADREAMGSLLVGLDKVLYLVDRCKVYELLYLHDPKIEHAYHSLETTVIELYVLILQFLLTAIRAYERSTKTSISPAFWTLDCINDYNARFEAIIPRIDHEAQNCERCYSRLDRVISTDKFERLKSVLEDIERVKTHQNEFQNADNTLQNIWRLLDDKKRNDVLGWISDIPFKDHHTLARTGRTANTGGWLFEQWEFQDWQLSKDSMIFWLHGISGAGKTKLVSRVIDEFLQDQGQKLVYFYCNRNEKLRRKPKEIIRSFVKQLSIADDQTVVHDSLLQVYNHKRQRGFPSTDLSLEESEALLAQLISTYPKTILVLDALDESEEGSRQGLISYFSQLVEQIQSLKIFITSRRDGDIASQLQTKANVGIDATANQDDIEKFVSQKIDEDTKNRATPISAELKYDIVRILQDKSQGMFQWVDLQATELLSLGLEDDIRERLGCLPADLQCAYNEIYQRILESKGSKFKIATRALQWVICSEKPLTAEALVFLVCQDPEIDTLITPYVDVRFILDSCSNLLVLDSRQFCQPSHLSVKEYFENLWGIGKCHANAAKICLTHMLIANNQFSQGSSRYSATIDNILTYATQHWFVHIRIYEHYIRNTGDKIDPCLSQLVEKFLGSVEESGPAYRSWCERCKHLPDFPIEDLKPFSNPVLAVCRFGLHRVPLTWWESKLVDPEQSNKAANSLLALTVFSENEYAVQKLLSLGADVNRQLDGLLCSRSALGAASSRGNRVIIELLLSTGAQINQKHTGGLYGSALVASVANPGGSKATQLLLDSGADINQELDCGIFGSALAAAATRGAGGYGSTIIQLLLCAGANVNQALTSGNYGSALAAAASTPIGHETIKLLLASGANANQRLIWGKYGSALAAAAFGSPANTSLLLDAGADVNQMLTSGLYGSALAAAAYSQAKHTVKLLLNAGADVNQKLTTGLYGSALAAAVAKPGADEEIVQLLLDAGAHVNQKLSSGLYSNVLEAARARTRPGLYEMLLGTAIRKDQ
ncbi:hypothetical protein BDV38DRAFT_285774 [Aspergillus pseudotamarii]|uniref:Nephrocystin 3-like N-terminal domain-containing protein n=1 Tax=Aspergillus pseudotamarii TaxID=132259 RepID=A0A5N6SIH5_ASPPS|nr:uncharacterized protein BDV38DRAFT_285774 [Aspergillus pseudotamarii]KAE8134486.1 hypothetical protein BDV38DRAFT_285774 [Aspergillus pseudotamarii]